MITCDGCITKRDSNPDIVVRSAWFRVIEVNDPDVDLNLCENCLRELYDINDPKVMVIRL